MKQCAQELVQEIQKKEKTNKEKKGFTFIVGIWGLH